MDLSFMCKAWCVALIFEGENKKKQLNSVISVLAQYYEKF